MTGRSLWGIYGFTSVVKPGPVDGWRRRARALSDALDPHWGGGAHGSVVNDATIAVGDEVRWEESAEGASP